MWRLTTERRRQRLKDHRLIGRRLCGDQFALRSCAVGGTTVSAKMRVTGDESARGERRARHIRARGRDRNAEPVRARVIAPATLACRLAALRTWRQTKRKEDAGEQVIAPLGPHATRIASLVCRPTVLDAQRTRRYPQPSAGHSAQTAEARLCARATADVQSESVSGTFSAKLRPHLFDGFTLHAHSSPTPSASAIRLPAAVARTTLHTRLDSTNRRRVVCSLAILANDGGQSTYSSYTARTAVAVSRV